MIKYIMQEKFLIKSFGNAGSMFVHYWLANNQNCLPLDVDYDIGINSRLLMLDDQSYSVHTHYYWAPKETHLWNFVHVCRKNLFNQAISSIIANYTKQWTRYNNKKFDPIFVEYKRVEDEIKCIQYWNAIFEVQSSLKWKKVYKLYFEDFIENNSKLEELRFTTEIKTNSKEYKSEKNPRKPIDVILNYNELLDQFYNK